MNVHISSEGLALNRLKRGEKVMVVNWKRVIQNYTLPGKTFDLPEFWKINEHETLKLCYHVSLTQRHKTVKNRLSG